MQPFTFFISYRRQDTAPIALLIKSEIEKRIKFVRVVVDVESMQIGDDFPPKLSNLIDESNATIVLIGKNWMPHKGTEPIPLLLVDWVTEELVYSNTTPFVAAGGDSHSHKKRFILPIFIDCPRDYRHFEMPSELTYLASLHAEQIDYAGWPTAIGPLLERLALRLGLKERPDSVTYPTPDPAKARTQPLADSELTAILRYDDFGGWYVDNFGNADARYLTKTFKFPSFGRASEFMTLVSNHCKIIDHHPEWRNVFDHITVSLTTWDAQRRVTIYDVNLALYMNMAAESLAKRK